MSDIRRAYDLLRGYVNHEWDRIRSIDVDKAWSELTSPSTSAERSDTVEESTAPAPDPKETACNILGVKADASFEEIKKAFDRLNTRSNPSNFPVGSEEAENASRIQTRVNWAYRVLTDDRSEAEKRFKSLEID